LFALKHSGNDIMGESVVDPFSWDFESNCCSGNGIGSHCY